MLRLLVVFSLLTGCAAAQTGTVRGAVTDESGALVPRARITVHSPDAPDRQVVAGADGAYTISGLPPGNYTLDASAPGLSLPTLTPIAVRPGAQIVNLALVIAVTRQQVTVAETGRPGVTAEASANASAVVLSGSDLDALSDNLDDLAADLQALAGPGAGPNGGAIFIDGFSGGQLPPKSSIREIRVNQNPFSPEYDRLGFGRIEIFTKPGTDKFRGDLGYNFATDQWNSRNPYAAEKAPFRLHELREGLSGPLGKRASFNITFAKEWVDNGNIVNGVVLDPASFLPTAFTDVPVATLHRTSLAPRVDYQLSANHTLSVRYSYMRDVVANAGVGSFNLVPRGYHNLAQGHVVQATETAVLHGNIVNETRFQYFRPENVGDANTSGPAINVLSAFNTGGAPLGHSVDRQNQYEIQNNTSILRGRHTWRFGVRVRAASDHSESPQNFNGTFTFGGGDNLTSIERYRRTILGLPGGGPTQFTISTGDPRVSGSQADAGVFVGDDWKARPGLTLSLGLRYETQTNLHDYRDFAPRIGVAWAPGAKSARSKPKTVLRAGFGMFYDRFPLYYTLAARRYNGLLQQQYVIANPTFYPDVPPISTLTGAAAPPSTIQQLSPTLQAPYLMQSALGVERELPFNTTVAFTYANTHALHMLRSRVFPSGRAVYQTESSGLYNQNQWIVNANSKVTRDVSLTGSYQYNRARSNTDGPGTFPANPYSMEGEYGPASTDMRHRVSLAGTVTAKWGIRLNPLLTVNSGPPFDITVGRDLYGDTLFNGRPAFATDPAKPGLIATAYGLLDPNPTPGQTLVPRNYGRGPGQVMLNLRIGRTFRFGQVKEGAAAANTGPGVGGSSNANNAPSSPFGVATSGGAATSTARRFSLTTSMQVRNVTNHNNPGPIIGNIASPLFGRANQLAGSGGLFSESANNRRLELQMRLTF
jgi:hypothetical protein